MAIMGSSCGREVCKKLGIEPGSFRRIIIDIEVDKVVKVYVEGFAEKGILDFEFPDPQFIQVIRSDDAEKFSLSKEIEKRSAGTR